MYISTCIDHASIIVDKLDGNYNTCSTHYCSALLVKDLSNLVPHLSFPILSAPFTSFPKLYPFDSHRHKVARVTMSLACLVCHSVDSPSPSHSFRSYSVSSSENEGRCHAVATCLTRKLSLPPTTVHSFLPPSSSSKVTPQPTVSGSNLIPGTPRLVRSHAVTRDRVRDWNFDEIVTES
ncbi:hypothetical protein RJT34_26589 [Clitoria ternatea]|uniref:Uncharacterized protein n=1 Tax=Clitoria ternatea TaxID=43366 RepID=A0AAN9F933_CLITE